MPTHEDLTKADTPNYMPEETGDLQTINVAPNEPVQLDFFNWMDSKTQKEKGKSFYQWLSDLL
tara:strand:- start:655 stop:843 length:189 start_codon:yes stop_codon:yes gene_type:complete